MWSDLWCHLSCSQHASSAESLCAASLTYPFSFCGPIQRVSRRFELSVHNSACHADSFWTRGLGACTPFEQAKFHGDMCSDLWSLSRLHRASSALVSMHCFGTSAQHSILSSCVACLLHVMHNAFLVHRMITLEVAILFSDRDRARSFSFFCFLRTAVDVMASLLFRFAYRRIGDGELRCFRVSIHVGSISAFICSSLRVNKKAVTALIVAGIVLCRPSPASALSCRSVTPTLFAHNFSCSRGRRGLARDHLVHPCRVVDRCNLRDHHSFSNHRRSHVCITTFGQQHMLTRCARCGLCVPLSRSRTSRVVAVGVSISSF